MFGLATEGQIKELKDMIGNHCTKIEKALFMSKVNLLLIIVILTAIISASYFLILAR